MKKYDVCFYSGRNLLAELDMFELPMADDFIVINYTKYTIYDFNWVISANFDAEATLQRVEIQLREVGRYNG
jgi:hypothetical protein